MHFLSWSGPYCLDKIDIVDRESIGAKEAFFKDVQQVQIAARNHEGLTELQDIIYSSIMGSGDLLQEREPCAPNIRHQAVLKEALSACGHLRQALSERVTMDLVAVEVQSALAILGDIVGLTTTDDVLDKIFAEFCIGK